MKKMKLDRKREKAKHLSMILLGIKKCEHIYRIGGGEINKLPAE